MSRLSQMLLNKQREDGLTDRQAAAELSELHGREISQQTYNAWKKGRTPTDAYGGALVRWLIVSDEQYNELLEEARSKKSGVPAFTAFAYVTPHGKIADRKAGKYRFEPYNMGRRTVPEGRYSTTVDTKVMEPVLHVGTQIWLDPAVAHKIGYEVMVHSDGYGWLGILESWDGVTALLSRPDGGNVSVKNVDAIHTIVLSARVAS